MSPFRNLGALLKPARLLALVDALCCVALLGLLAADLIFPRAMLFLKRPVKVFILVACLLSAVCGGLLVARRRAALRRQ